MGVSVTGKTVVITGGAQGIGAALAKRCLDDGARVAILDRARIPIEGVLSLACDVTDQAQLSGAIDKIEKELGAINVFVSNAGVLSKSNDPIGTDDDWLACWQVNVMAHVLAARLVVPRMVARGSGWIVNVASAAGLLNQIGDAAYSASKHAAVSFAETLAITYGDAGVGVSVVCPQYVATPLIGLSDGDVDTSEALLSADEVALSILSAMQAGNFLVLPHAEVQSHAEFRAREHDRWIKGMRRLRGRAIDQFGEATPEAIYKLL